MLTEVGGIVKFRKLVDNGPYGTEVTEDEFLDYINNFSWYRSNWGNTDQYIADVGGRDKILGYTTLGDPKRYYAI
jgi:hypothetical protein